MNSCFRTGAADLLNIVHSTTHTKMPKNVLVLKCSVKSEGGASNKLIARVLAKLNAGSDAVVVTTHDLGTDSLPPINGAFCAAMWSPEKSPEQAETLAKAMAFIEDLRAADVVVIGCPIYNFGPAATLKSFFDMVVMNNVTFKYVDGAPVGTLPEGKKAIICYSSAGTPVGGPSDFASGWLKHILGFIGIKDSTIVGVGCSAYPGQEDRDKQEEEQIAAL